MILTGDPEEKHRPSRRCWCDLEILLLESMIVWNENDYSGSNYNNFSVLKSIAAGLGLPCLNHACDSDVHVMSDLFGAEHGNQCR